MGRNSVSPASGDCLLLPQDLSAVCVYIILPDRQDTSTAPSQPRSQSCCCCVAPVQQHFPCALHARALSQAPTWNISPAPSQSEAVTMGVCTYRKPCSCRQANEGRGATVRRGAAAQRERGSSCACPSMLGLVSTLANSRHLLPHPKHNTPGRSGGWRRPARCGCEPPRQSCWCCTAGWRREGSQTAGAAACNWSLRDAAAAARMAAARPARVHWRRRRQQGRRADVVSPRPQVRLFAQELKALLLLGQGVLCGVCGAQVHHLGGLELNL